MDRSKWEYKKLGEVATFLNGYAFKPENWSKHGLKIIRIQNLTDETAPYNCYDGDIDPKYIVRNGDLLISWSATLGAFLWNNDDALLNQHIFKTIFDKSDIDKYYLKYCVISKLEEMAKKSHGVTMRHITKKDFDNTIIPYPSISDQQRIVAELDCLNEMIAVKQEQLKEFDKLAQSIFYDMFGDPVLNEKRWEIRPLGELISIMGGFAFKSSSYVDIGIRLVQIANVWEDNIKWDEITHVPKEDVNKRPDYLLKPGDIVMALTRPIIKSLGSVKIARIRNCDIPCALNQRVCKFAFSNSLLSPHWFYHFARTDYFKDMINSFSSKGMQPNVSTKEIESILTPYIPLSLQQQFADKISAIEAQKELVKQSIAETQALLDYTMDKYFG